ncbi:unnamed protein product, partial [Iphiclides podalirius]
MLSFSTGVAMQSNLTEPSRESREVKDVPKMRKVPKTGAERIREYRARIRAQNATIPGPAKNVEAMESTMSALDKFKRRLVRDIARRLYQEKQEESEMWSQLNREYGCDCHLLWDHMRALTLKKLKRLLAAEDRVDYITRIARMTTTDWLTFDMVLVHQKVDVIGEDLILAGKPEPAVLTHLFNLVQKHNIEVLPPKFRVEYWQKLTKEYNTDGRHCSPMLLQRRWYQLKELTRTKIYDFWQSYRGNPKLYEKASERKPTKLQMLIAEKYKTLITQPFEQWEELLSNKMVVPAGAFERKKIKETFNTDNDPDIIVVEPQVETIELPADSDSDDVVTNDVKLNTDSTKVVKEVTVKTEIDDDLLENDAIQKLESMEIPIEKEEHHFEPIEKDSGTDGIFLPKITSVMGNVVMAESDSKVNEAACENIQVAAQERNMTPCEDDNDDVKIFETPVNEDLIVADNVKACPDMKSEVEKQKGSLSNFNELSVHLEFVDDGIELEDNDVKYQGTTKSQFIKEETDQYLISKESAESISEDENNTECKIDLKLIMFPITYTIKLDHMETFKNISFLTVKGNDVIGRALAENPIILLDDDEPTSYAEDQLYANNPVLPKGVRLILLPDKGLSVALDPDAKIEQADLEKLPPILSAIEKHLHESTLVKYSSEGLVPSEVNSNSDPDNTTMNSKLAATNPNSHSNVPSAHVDINQVTASNLQQTTDSVNNTLTVVVSQSGKTKEDNNCDPIYQEFLMKILILSLRKVHQYNRLQLYRQRLIQF